MVMAWLTPGSTKIKVRGRKIYVIIMYKKKILPLFFPMYHLRFLNSTWEGKIFRGLFLHLFRHRLTSRLILVVFSLYPYMCMVLAAPVLSCSVTWGSLVRISLTCHWMSCWCLWMLHWSLLMSGDVSLMSIDVWGYLTNVCWCLWMLPGICWFSLVSVVVYWCFIGIC